jgi:BirA family biotin operon repressor/biotin-[acetyl-CoA-carboxylase] ligase
MLSLGWSFASETSLAGLSLAVGVAVAETLEDLGVSGVGLKWPNDAQVGGCKICGILIETRLSPGAPPFVVVGIGLNTSPHGSDEGIGQPFTDLESETGEPADRSTVAATLLDRLIEALREYESAGFAAFRERFARRDLARDRAVGVEEGGRTLSGRAVGIDEEGALLVEIDGTVRRFHSGEVSLRLSPFPGPASRR